MVGRQALRGELCADLGMMEMMAPRLSSFWNLREPLAQAFRSPPNHHTPEVNCVDRLNIREFPCRVTHARVQLSWRVGCRSNSRHLRRLRIFRTVPISSESVRYIIFTRKGDFALSCASLKVAHRLKLSKLWTRCRVVQGYLAHRKTPIPLGPP